MFVGRSLAFILPSRGSVLSVDAFLSRSVLGIVIAWIGVTAMTSGGESVKEWWGTLTTDPVSMDEVITTDGLGQVQGSVRPTPSNSTLVSPLQNKECVAYEYTISKVVQDAGDSTIDADSKYGSFIISDGTAEILVKPDEDSLSLNMTTTRPTSRQEIMEQTSDERLDLESSAYTSDVGDLTAPIELSEGTISVGENITVVGNATPVPADAFTDADAVMTSEEAHLTIMNDDPGNTALKKAARGGFLLVLGVLFSVFGMLVLITAVSNIV
jgi:hypothetical protein